MPEQKDNKASPVYLPSKDELTDWFLLKNGLS